MKGVGRHLLRGRALVLRWLVPGAVGTQWNTWNLYRDIAWYGFLSAVTTTFTSVFALRLGASNLLVGVLTSLPALLNILFQIPAARVIERQGNRRGLILWSGFLMRLPALLVALVPLAPTGFRASAVVYVTALGTVPGAMSNVAFTAMLAEVVAPEDRARVVSVRNGLLATVTTLTVIAAGKALDILPFPVSYQIIFALAFSASLASLYYVSRLAIPERGPSVTQRMPLGGADPRQWGRVILAERPYARFLLASFWFHWGLHFPVALYAVYKVRTLGLGDGWIGALAMVESTVTAVAYYVWGRIAQKRGSASVLLFGALITCFYPIGTALSRSPWSLVLVAAVAGVAGPAFNLGLFNGLLEVSPSQGRATYLAVFNTLMNVAGFASPLLGATTAQLFGIHAALWVGGVARLVGVLGYARVLPGRGRVQSST